MNVRSLVVVTSVPTAVVAIVFATAQPWGSATQASEWAAQSSEFEQIELGECETPDDAEPLSLDDRGTAGQGPLPDVVSVSVYIHVINRGPLPTDGNVADESIRAQMDILNDAFAAGQGGAATRFRFALMAVQRITNPTWHTMTLGSAAEDAAKRALRVGGAETLNVYIVRRGAWAHWPWHYNSAPDQDGVVLGWPHMPGLVVSDGLDGGALVNVNLRSTGDPLVHEVGHWLGLYHTFQGGCGNDAFPKGDEVADTPAHQQPNECNQADTCPANGADPTHNFMNYGDDSCRWEFTPGQVDRIDKKYRKYRLEM